MNLDGFGWFQHERERETTDSQTQIHGNPTERDEENACCR